MNFSLLTYNILFNIAFKALPKILEEYQPDIVCLQEIETNEENLKRLEFKNYALADYANCFIKFGKIYGVATYYNRKKLRLLNSRPIPLSRSFYENFTYLLQIFNKKEIKRTILKTNLYLNSVKKRLTIYNIHLSAISFNTLRIKQLNSINFGELNYDHPMIISGDFNFPIERKKLEKIMNQYKLKEATNNLFYTLKYPKNAREYKYFFFQRLLAKALGKIWTDKLKLDYIFYRGLKNLDTQRIDVNFSDHYPILSKFQLIL